MRPQVAAWAVVCAGLMATAVSNAPAESRTLRWARSIDATTLDPHAANTGPNLLLGHQIYEPLIVRQFDGKMLPALATAWALTRDPTVWEFKIRPNVTFHNGATLDADDVVFSLDRARAPKSDMKSLLSSVETVTRADPLTVRIKTRGPDPLLPNNLTDVLIMDRGWAETHRVAEPQDISRGEETVAASRTNGTGPYTLVSREPGVKTVLRRNEAYWGTREVPLEISEIVFLPIRDNAARVAALLAGEIDFVQDVPVAEIERLREAPQLRVTTSPENRSIFLGMDVGSKALRSSSLKGRNPFADRRVRQAIDLAVDREWLQRSVMRGQSAPAGVIVPPFSNGYTADLDRLSRLDLPRARTLMREAGHEAGFDVALHCTSDRYVADEALCRAIAAMLEPIAIRVTPKPQPASEHFTQVRRAELDFYLLGWGVTTFDSEYIFSLLYHTSGNGLGGWNGTRFSDAAVDAQIRTLRGEVDQTRRNAAIASLWRKLKGELIYIPLHNQTITHAMHRDFDIPIDVSNQPKMKFVGFRR